MDIKDVSISVENFMVIKSEKFELNRLNVFTGVNNIGKSILGKLTYCFFNAMHESFENIETRQINFDPETRDSPIHYLPILLEVLDPDLPGNLVKPEYLFNGNFEETNGNSKIETPSSISKKLKAFHKSNNEMFHVDKTIAFGIFNHLYYSLARQLTETFTMKFSELFQVNSNKELRFLRQNKSRPWKIIYAIDGQMAIELTDSKLTNKKHIGIKLKLMKQFDYNIMKIKTKEKIINYQIIAPNCELRTTELDKTVNSPKIFSNFERALSTILLLGDTLGLSSSLTSIIQNGNKIDKMLLLAARLILAIKNEFLLLNQNSFEKPLFLPASRSGLLQSYEVVATTYLQVGSKMQLNRTASTGYSGEIRDFLQIMMFSNEKPKTTSKEFEKLKMRFEKSINNILGGRIEFPSNQSEAIKYHVKDKDFSMAEVSSLVTELLPLQAIITKNYILPNGLLIIEEPESHLHPGAQNQLVKVLANFINAGVHLLITTHSPAFYYKLLNLIIASKVEPEVLNQIKFPKPLNTNDVIKSDDVRIWNFKRKPRGKYTFTEIVQYKSETDSYSDLFHDELNLQYRELSEIYKKLEAGR